MIFTDGSEVEAGWLSDATASSLLDTSPLTVRLMRSQDAIDILNLIRKEKSPNKKALNAVYIMLKFNMEFQEFLEKHNKQADALLPYYTVLRLKKN
jgi:hypothetical protein